MAHFAKVENGIVTNVLVVANEHEDNGQEYLNGLGLEGDWIQTSYHGNIRKKFAGIGDEYLADKDAFRPPPPFPSWVFDFKKWEWNAPVPYPTDGKNYTWDEDAGEWVLVETEA
jgi:hypothetical protein